jgi:apolipoprotein D and lipocalin family protein
VRNLCLLLLGLVMTAPMVQAQNTTAVRAVDSLDLHRYAGQWYEIARFPNQFQLKCVANVMAKYTLLANGQVEVLNTCRESDGTTDSAIGRAKLADKYGPASRLKVRFAPGMLGWIPMVWGDYWVLDLTDDYGAALVGTPDREFLWILSRTPTLDPAVYERLIATAQRQAFDVKRLVPTRQE